MGDSWLHWCRAKDLSVEGSHIDVQFGDGRRHRVSVEEQAEAFELTAVVVRRSISESIPELPMRAWLRNRATPLVGFRLDQKGRLLGESWVPKAGLSAGEFQLYVRHLAATCDHFEYALTGKDIE